MDSPRIPPVEPPYGNDVMDELARWMPRGAPVEPLALFRTLARHLPLAQAMLPLGKFLLGRHAALGIRERELVIQRVCARLGCEYEWGVHATFFGESVGLTPAEIAKTTSAGAEDPVWSADERAVIQLADELHDTAAVSDATFAELERHFGAAQILELVIAGGWYHTISFVIAAARVQREPWAARFPAPRAGAVRR